MDTTSRHNDPAGDDSALSQSFLHSQAAVPRSTDQEGWKRLSGQVADALSTIRLAANTLCSSVDYDRRQEVTALLREKVEQAIALSKVLCELSRDQACPARSRAVPLDLQREVEERLAVHAADWRGWQRPAGSQTLAGSGRAEADGADRLPGAGRRVAAFRALAGALRLPAVGKGGGTAYQRGAEEFGVVRARGDPRHTRGLRIAPPRRPLVAAAGPSPGGRPRR